MLPKDMDYTVQIGVEWEWYINKSVNEATYLALILGGCHKKSINLYGLQPETETNQFEISLPPTENLAQLIADYNTVNHIINTATHSMQAETLFEVKPYPNQSGSGLHIHISLYDKKGTNLCIQENTEESDVMLHAIGGLCTTMKQYMSVFAPNKDSVDRLRPMRGESDNTCNASYAPTHVSWGGNNRTTAIRIPTSTLNPNNRHIEHRVAGVDANLDDVIAAILHGIDFGIKNKIAPPSKCYGNAWESQYGFEPLIDD